MCDAYTEECAKCELSFSREGIKSHDCFTELMKKSDMKDQETKDLQQEFGVNYEVLNVKCSRYH